MRIAALLRLTAIGLALLCVLDPPVVVVPAAPLAVDIVQVRSTEGDEQPGTQQAARALHDALRAESGVRLRSMVEGDSVPCEAFRPCVLVGPSRARVLTAKDRETPTFVVGLEPQPGDVEVASVEASASHPTAEGEAVVTLDGTGMAGRETQVTLHDGAALVGEGTHRWRGDGRVDVRLSWWPIAAGRRELTVRARTTVIADGAASATDSAAWSTPVVVGAEPWMVLVHERRPSWASTFARRALALDPRFALVSRTDLAPRIAATPARGAAGGLTPADLDAARVVVVGAPEALTTDDVSRLERFVRVRGGAIVLVPDQAFSGPVTRLLTERWRERVRPALTTTAGLAAREWLVADGQGPFDRVLGSLDDRPALLETPMGAGRVLVIGALDAWRSRARDAQFDRFWQQTVASLAAAAPPPVAVSVHPSVARPGDTVRVRVQAHSVTPSERLVASATLACGGARPVDVRLWPASAAGAFEGVVRLPADEAQCDVQATVGGVGEEGADGRVSVTASRRDTPGGRVTLADVGRSAVYSGGRLVGTDGIPEVAAALTALRSGEGVPERRYPMRSSWWLLLLLVCVGGEWWLRRQAGLR